MIALLRSMDMPLADVRRVLRGVTDDERQELFVEHRRRLEDRLQEVRELLEVVDAMVSDDSTTADVTSDPNGWLHAMPRLPVTDLDRSIEYYEEALGLRLAWRTADGSVAAMASGPVEYLLLVPWVGDGPPPPQASYVYVEDPTSCAPSSSQRVPRWSSRWRVGRTVCATSRSVTLTDVA